MDIVQKLRRMAHGRCYEIDLCDAKQLLTRIETQKGYIDYHHNNERHLKEKYKKLECKLKDMESEFRNYKTKYRFMESAAASGKIYFEINGAGYELTKMPSIKHNNII